MIRSLAVEANAEVLGRSFQGRAAIRALDDENQLRLLAYAERLLLEPRARLLPEERLEALLLAGDEDAVTRLVRDEPAGIAEERRRYLMTEVVRRDRDLVDQLRDLYTGECQISGWAPRRSYGTELRESHHVRWLSRGGGDELGNLVLVCPNQHRAIHRCDAPFDFGHNAFVFATNSVVKGGCHMRFITGGINGHYLRNITENCAPETEEVLASVAYATGEDLLFEWCGAGAIRSLLNSMVGWTMKSPLAYSGR